jgi:ABC transport system ATP-binding/permease protein
VTSTLVFEGNGQVREYVGGYADWLRQSGEKPGPLQAGARQSARAGATGAGAGEARGEPVQSKTSRRLSYNEKRELATLPETIQSLEEEQARLQGLTNDPDFFKKEPAEAALALKRLTSLASELEAAYVRWGSLESLTS